MIRKSTNKELIEELVVLNKDGRYDQLIDKAKRNFYHDYKNPEGVICGKLELWQDLVEFPELNEIRTAVANGEYDETADESDKEMMRKDLPKSMWAMFGL